MEYIDHVKTDPQELDKFIHLSNAYLGRLKTIKANILNANTEMRLYWKDKQYNRVRDVLERDIQRIDKQIRDLEFLTVLVQKKRQILLKAE